MITLIAQSRYVQSNFEWLREKTNNVNNVYFFFLNNLDYKNKTSRV